MVSTKVSKRAVRRNRLRRLLHHHLLHHLLASSSGAATPQWLVISLKVGAAEAEESRLLEECTHLLRQAALLP